ncbi:hypothetical protein CgunFtcFv8_006838 [Champsocephalus gunnari]|uniref:Claudin n=1 Tax=Champsocephalus gunnari TaxID=52237 RepID=A0AAN8H5N1_CHAGU|nr:hypothetical protein CgunFtcFv8_006838 [Champsocephalus gunnari]
MLPGSVQILAFVLALLGLLGALVATLLPSWTVSAPPRPGLPPPPPWRMQGLWMDCVSPLPGVFSCSVKPSPLTLPASLQVTRASMVLCCLAAAFGLCLAALGLKCTKWGGGRRAKGGCSLGGALGLAFCASGFLLAGGGILCLSCPGLESRRPDHASNEDQDWFLVLQRRPPPPPNERKEAEAPPPKELSEKYSRHEYV